MGWHENPTADVTWSKEWFRFTLGASWRLKLPMSPKHRVPVSQHRFGHEGSEIIHFENNSYPISGTWKLWASSTLSLFHAPKQGPSSNPKQGRDLRPRNWRNMKECISKMTGLLRVKTYLRLQASQFLGHSTGCVPPLSCESSRSVNYHW